MGRSVVGGLMSLAGAIVGAGVGLGLYKWLQGQGFDAMVLPGAFLGLGAYLASPSRSIVRGVVLGVAALALGLVTEWWDAPLVKDASLPYFVTHFYDLRPGTLLMIALGGLFGFWWGKESSPWLGDLARRERAGQVKDRVEGD